MLECLHVIGNKRCLLNNVRLQNLRVTASVGHESKWGGINSQCALFLFSSPHISISTLHERIVPIYLLISGVLKDTSFRYYLQCYLIFKVNVTLRHDAFYCHLYVNAIKHKMIASCLNYSKHLNISQQKMCLQWDFILGPLMYRITRVVL